MTYARNIQRPKNRTAAPHVFAPPTAGWIENRNLAAPQGAQGAALLDNWFPTSTTVILRRGRQEHADIGATVTELFTYSNGNNEKMFAASADTIFDVTSETPETVWEGATSGDWSTEQFATDGGIYLIGVNGASAGFIYDGQAFWPIVAGGVWSLSIDNVTTPFVGGEVVTGGTSGATATVLRVDTDILYLTDIIGTFEDNEALTGSIAGDADVDAASGQVSVAPGITFPDGYTTTDMSYVWVYQQRLWFVRRNSLDVYYLDPGTVGGAATAYPMGGIFNLGGSIVWGSAWALDTGADGGLSDQCIMCTTEGQIAVFQGLSPDDVQSWRYVGVYRVGRPLGKHAHFRGSGDVAIATSVGLVPVSRAIRLDITALSQGTISYNIADAWARALVIRGDNNWRCQLWPDQKMALVSPPLIIGSASGGDPVVFVVNTETGAWCRFTNWDARSMCVFQGKLYLAGEDGIVYQGNISGIDADFPYTASYVPLFDDFGAPFSIKVPQVARATIRGAERIVGRLSFQTDFKINLPPAPNPPVPALGSNVWGSGIWGQSTWGLDLEPVVTQDIQMVGGIGTACALALQVSSGSLQPLDAEIIRLDMTYTTAAVVTA